MFKHFVYFVAFINQLAFQPCHSQDAQALKLKDFRPQSIYKVPVTIVKRAKFPVVDMHSHDYAKTPEEVVKWVKTMDGAGIEKTIILSGATGRRFDSIYSKYAVRGNRFEIWCGFDLIGYDKPGWSEKAVRELERCVKMGARGVGEQWSAGGGGGADDLVRGGFQGAQVNSARASTFPCSSRASTAQAPGRPRVLVL